MSLGASAPIGVEVAIFYKKVSIASDIEFILKNGIEDKYPDIISIIDRCVKSALENRHSPQKSTLYCLVSSVPRLAIGLYEGLHWSSTPLTNGLTKIAMTVEGFDDADVRNEFASRSEQFLDALSCMTNISYNKAPLADDVVFCANAVRNNYFQDVEWLDDFPILDEKIGLSKSQIDYLDGLICDSVNNEELICAAHVFHRAIALYRNFHEYNDVAVALFCSTLETLSLSQKKAEKCPECGQIKYSISQRIYDLVDHHLGGGITHIVKQAYASRSNYLHEGKLKVSRIPTEHIIPLLASNGVEGCAAMRTNVQVNVLMESTSYIFRRLVSHASDDIS